MSDILLVTEKPEDWQGWSERVQVVTPGAYFSSADYTKYRKYKVINLCKSYQYQSLGYYVSLLAEARSHKVMPQIATLQDFRFPTLVKEDAEDFDAIIQSVLKKTEGDKLELFVCFGKVQDQAFAKIGTLLFNLFQVPVLKAQFVRKEKWMLGQLRPHNVGDLPETEKELLNKSLEEYVLGKNRSSKQFSRKKYDLAILINPEEQTPPSNKKALANFVKAGEKIGFNVDFITKNDFAKLIQYDALFIRETTNVNHHTFKFAKKAAAEGLVVMDDPESILRCTNKVYLSELLQAHKIPTPAFQILRKDKTGMIPSGLEYPVILKQPDGSFSKGVKKARDEAELKKVLADFFQTSELVIAQEFIPTDFDWRVGILNKQPLYVCRYYMAANHWQIVNWKNAGSPEEGDADTIAVEDAPKALLDLAVKATALIGDGLYGVDIKQRGKKFYIIEINDNPNLDEGVEDQVLKQKLYQQIMQEFMNRLV
ncbi:RimK family protein [Marinoscillum furvescens]|uniref:Glutathione synthase/RimK-type ligase-like ATP-grasp enzyme n=1 Tax=Marinoscillum furvescens DSM 4134 TaxID=1122208 RepID=A0A3D9LG95_MARFU|nr:RimK family protein [Marinoscillum furvescens]REE05700.1 glutathione synthase/RimK-type ligase-like ATP-grasp enzyme [Marinoscillum furvescens DSM 4134]